MKHELIEIYRAWPLIEHRMIAEHQLENLQEGAFVHVDFREVKFKNIQGSFSNCNLGNCYFEDCQIEIWGSTLGGFYSSILRGCIQFTNCSIKLLRCNVYEAQFTQCTGSIRSSHVTGGSLIGGELYTMNTTFRRTFIDRLECDEIIFDACVFADDSKLFGTWVSIDRDSRLEVKGTQSHSVAHAPTANSETIENQIS